MDKEQIINYLVSEYSKLAETRKDMLYAANSDEYDEKTRANYYEFYRSYRSKCILLEQIAYDMMGIDLFDLWLES